MGADPLANTKAFFADIRTNIIDIGSTQTFGLSPIVQSVATDVRNNVEPPLDATVLAVSAMTIAQQQIAAGAAGLSVGSTADMDGPASLVPGPSGSFIRRRLPG